MISQTALHGFAPTLLSALATVPILLVMGGVAASLLASVFCSPSPRPVRQLTFTGRRTKAGTPARRTGEKSTGLPSKCSEVQVLVKGSAPSTESALIVVRGNVQHQGKRTSARMFVDCGAEVTLIGESLVETAHISPIETTLSGFAGSELIPLGSTTLSIAFGKSTYPTKVIVVPDSAVPLTGQVLLGLDFLTANDCALSFTKRELAIGPPRARRTIHAITRENPASPALPTKVETTTGTVPTEYLNRFPALFAEPISLPPRRPGIDMTLHLTGKPPVSREIRMKNPRFTAHLNTEVAKLQAAGFIRPAPNPQVNPCSAFIVIDHASDGRGKEKLRVVYDYVKLNAVTDVLPAVLPRILDLLRSCCASRHFSKMDIRAGFHNLRMAEDSIPLTACLFPGLGIYEWLVMPFGLAGAPGAMQALMRHILGDLEKTHGVIIYLDDILVHAETQEKHDATLELVLRRLEKHAFHLKPEKCALNQTMVDFLGHRLRHGTYEPMVSNVAGILEFPLPNSVNGWQRFHGMCNFYRLHIPRFSDILRPIAAVLGVAEKELSPGHVFTTEQRRTLAKAVKTGDENLQVAFAEAKKALAAATPLTTIDNTRQLYITTDASRVGWAAVVSHQPDGSAPPVAWLSGSFSKAELGWPSIHREVYALVATFRKYPELFAAATLPIQVLTDSEHLVRWGSLDVSSERLAGWNETLGTFNFRLRHIPGSQNVVADALSRPVDDNNRAWTGKVFPETATASDMAEIANPPRATPRASPAALPSSLPATVTTLLLRDNTTRPIFKSDEQIRAYADQGLGIRRAFDERITRIHAKKGSGYDRSIPFTIPDTRSTLGCPVGCQTHHECARLGLQPNHASPAKRKRNHEAPAPTICSPNDCRCLVFRSCMKKKIKLASEHKRDAPPRHRKDKRLSRS